MVMVGEVDVSALEAAIKRAKLETRIAYYALFARLQALAHVGILEAWAPAGPVLAADDEWLKPAEAAAILKISVKTLSRRRFKLPFIRPNTGSRGFRVSRRGLREFMREQRPLWESAG